MKSNPDKTVLTISVGLLVIYLIFKINFLIYIILIIGSTSILFERIGLLYEKIWFGIAYVLGLIIPNILLSIIFFLILTPIAFIYKLFNPDPLMLNSKKRSTYFINSKYDLSKNNFEKIW